MGTYKQNSQRATALRDIEEHLSDVGIGSITRRILVELVDENDEVLDAEIPALQVLAKLGHDPSEDEILRIFLEVGDIHYVHRAIGKAPKGEIADSTGVGNETGTAGGDVGQAIPHLADRRDVVRPPALTSPLLHREKRNATVRAVTSVNVLTLGRDDFTVLTKNWAGLRQVLLQASQHRAPEISEYT